MKAGELRDLPVEELTRRATEMRENLFNLRIRHSAGTLDSSADLKKHRHDLARVLTVLNQKKRRPPATPLAQPEAEKKA
jgi:large subunit ribosomal protein L29